MKKSVYEIITEDMLKEIKSENKLPWHMPWITNLPKNILSNKDYKGFNSMMLNYYVHKHGYSSPYFGTFKQISEKGGQIIKGQKGYNIIYFSFVERKNNLGEVIKTYPLLRYSKVFNLDQAKGEKLEEYKIKREETLQTKVSIEDKIDVIENHINECQKDNRLPFISYSGNKACYIPSVDTINLPKIKQFRSIEEYYSTLFHESIHATGHKDRLEREQVTNINFFGSHEYSKEELTAEMGACFLSSKFDIYSDKAYNNSKAYIKGWISVLENDPKMLIQASSKAQKAVDYLMDNEED